MAKLTAWLVTLIGVILTLDVAAILQLGTTKDWIIAIAVLVVGIGKLMRNYKKGRK
jgi:general stress protein CsbA